MDPKTIIFWLYLAVSGVIALVSVPFILGMVPPNPFYGLRLKKTRDDPAAWYTANRFMSWRMLAAAALIASVAVGAYALLPGLGLGAYSLTCLGATVVGVGSAFALTWRHLRGL